MHPDQVLGNSACMFLVSLPLKINTMSHIERFIEWSFISQGLNPYLIQTKMVGGASIGGGPLLEEIR